MAVYNNLYPPVFPTYAPAFVADYQNVIDNKCRIYFSLSAYNSEEEIQLVHITVTDQKTNRSVLNSSKYPSQIKLAVLNRDSTRATDDRYYIEINATDLVNEKFEINTYYRVQIRFSLVGHSLGTPQAIDGWLVNNLENFSEWSTVCLIRGISNPLLTLKNFDEDAEYTIWESSNVDLVGSLSFPNNPAETEQLRSYKFTLCDAIDDTEILNSGDIYPEYHSNINEVNYIVPYQFDEAVMYRIKIDYVTINLYRGSKSYDFMVIENAIDPLDATLNATADEENGRIQLRLVNNISAPFAGKITIRRTSSESNFTIWEDVNTIELRNESLNYTWYDQTIKSGVWYKYGAQRRDKAGKRGIITYIKSPIMVVFEHMYLGADDTQIKIKFNPEISSFRRSVIESKTETLGSKYPFIKRNGATDYKSFDIKGLISFFMDENDVFTSREHIYNDNSDIIDLYDDWNTENKITPHYDITYERDYRDKISDFLYKNNVKLFRSATEGNILVKLTNISFTPETALGRKIYSFSCEAHEVADFTLANCDYYGVQTIEKEDHTGELITYGLEFEGQWQDKIPANTDLIDLLNEYYQKIGQSGYITSVKCLDFLRIEMEQKPYAIVETNNGPQKRTDTETPAYMGYIVYINEKPIIMNSEGIYELKGKDIEITSVYFPEDTQVNISYHALIKQEEDLSKILKTTTFISKVGQEWGTFEPGKSISSAIWDKYYEDRTTYYQNLISINGMRVEAEPNTVIYVSESEENGFDRHVIGPTCSLDFYDPDSIIEAMYFTGIHFEPATDYEARRVTIPDGKYVETGIITDDLDSIENPIKNGVYTLAVPTRGEAAASEQITVLASVITIKDIPVTYLQDENIVIIKPEDEEILRDYIENELGHIVLLEGSEEVARFNIVQDTVEERQKITAYNTITNNRDLQFSQLLTASTIKYKYIYYNNKWYPFTDTHDVVCPVPAIVDYYCEVMRGYYLNVQEE